MYKIFNKVKTTPLIATDNNSVARPTFYYYTPEAWLSGYHYYSLIVESRLTLRGVISTEKLLQVAPLIYGCLQLRTATFRGALFWSRDFAILYLPHYAKSCEQLFHAHARRCDALRLLRRAHRRDWSSTSTETSSTSRSPGALGAVLWIFERG